MRFFRFFVATLWLAALGLSAPPAHALGTLTFSPPQWTKRLADRPINILNRKDCLDGATASFSYSIKNASGGTFQVWSGAACDQAANRSATAVSKTCVKVAEGATTETRIELPFSSMVRSYSAAETDVGKFDAADCDSPQGAGLQTRSLFFVVFNPQDNSSLVASSPASWKFSYDILAPAPPSNVSAQPGDLTLVAKFTPSTAETNLLHYHFYCSEKGATPTSDAGTGGTAGTASTTETAGTDTAGTDATTGGTDATTGGANDVVATAGTSGTSTETPTTLDPTCQSSILIPGQPVPKDAVDCGDIAAQAATGGETSPVLQNGTEYVVAVAAEDSANNIGVLSGLACNTPRDTTGFYEAYSKAGGQAGGGYCSFAPARRDSMALTVAFLLGACALWRRRQ